MKQTYKCHRRGIDIKKHWKLLYIVFLFYVERMDNERLLKKVMNAKVDGRSAGGRPRFGWMDGVKRALNDRRIDMREASHK